MADNDFSALNGSRVEIVLQGQCGESWAKKLRILYVLTEEV